jgi:hypothetical protein
MTMLATPVIFRVLPPNSLQKGSRKMFPETGRKIPSNVPLLTSRLVSDRVAAALKSELGTSRQAAKTIMAWTGVCDKAARIWISGEGGLSGFHLLQLARHSDAMWKAILEMAAREEAALGFDIHAAEVVLRQALDSIEMLKRQMIVRGDAGS